VLQVVIEGIIRYPSTGTERRASMMMSVYKYRRQAGRGFGEGEGDEGEALAGLTVVQYLLHGSLSYDIIRKHWHGIKLAGLISHNTSTRTQIAASQDFPPWTLDCTVLYWYGHGSKILPEMKG